MEYPEKLATLGTQDTRRRHTTQSRYVLDTTMRKQTQNNVNKTRDILPTTGGKDEPNIFFMRTSQRTSRHGTQNVKAFDRTKCWTSLCANTHKKHNKTWALLQTTRGKTNRTSFSCGNRNGHHNTELWTEGYIIGQHKKLKRLATRTPPKYRGWALVLTKCIQFLILVTYIYSENLQILDIARRREFCPKTH